MDKLEALEKENYKLRNKVNSFSHEISKLVLEITNLKKAIEHARENKSRIGAELALRELVIDVKEGNISSKYRDKETIKMLEEKFNE